MPSAVSGFTPTVTSTSTTTKGFNDINGQDFMKVMIAQLQQQDPLDPAKSDQLLTQISQIKALESNQALKDSLQGLTLQQSIGAGGNLIGKTIRGIDDRGDNVTGIVTSVRVENKKVSLELDSGKSLPLANVTQIASTSPQATSPAGLASLAQTVGGNNADLSSLLSSLGGGQNASSLLSMLSGLTGN